MATICDVDILELQPIAARGELVGFSTRTYNLTDEVQNIQTMVVVESTESLFNEQQDVPPGSVDNQHSFIMPSGNVLIGAYTFYRGTDGLYHYDGFVRQEVTLGAGGSDISSIMTMMMPMIMMIMMLAIVAPMTKSIGEPKESTGWELE